MPTNKYIAKTADPFGFNFAKLNPASEETAKHKKTDPKTSFAELKKIFVYSPAIQASGKFCNLISDGGPKGFKPNSLKGLIELKNKTKIGSTAKSANKINIKWFGIASFLLKFETNIYISQPNFLKRPNIPTINIT